MKRNRLGNLVHRPGERWWHFAWYYVEVLEIVAANSILFLLCTRSVLVWFLWLPFDDKLRLRENVWYCAGTESRLKTVLCYLSLDLDEDLP